MDPTTYAKVDYLARCADNAIEIGLAVAMLIIAPPGIRKKIKDGKLSEAKGRLLLRLVWPVFGLMILYSIYRIVYG